MGVPFIQQPVDPENHHMFNSLESYIKPRIHPEIESANLERIIVKGCYRRSGDAIRISKNEKNEKRFNWHRPTANVLSDGTLELLCFPGRDYVKHHALLTATHLSLRHKTAIVEHLPLMETSLDIFLHSNLRLMGSVNTAVIGYVDRILPEKLQAGWKRGTSELDQIFAWKTYRQSNGDVVAFIGCLVSFWGDIFESVVHALKLLNNTNCIIYIGKAGSLRPSDVPNSVLVTGNTSYIDDDLISWDNPLIATINKSQTVDVSQGTHVTVSSPLMESASWFSTWKDKAQWVDCEVGHIARACKELHVKFGYLHIISDNVATYYPQNLTTDRDANALFNRQIAFHKIWCILKDFLGIEDLHEITE